MHDFVCVVEAAFVAVLEHVLDEEGVGLVAHFEHVLSFDQAEPLFRRLQVVQGLPHVTLQANNSYSQQGKKSRTFEIKSI